MDFNYINNCQYLLNSHINYTLTNLANHLGEISHDQINRYLKMEDLSSCEKGNSRISRGIPNF